MKTKKHNFQSGDLVKIVRSYDDRDFPPGLYNKLGHHAIVLRANIYDDVRVHLQDGTRWWLEYIYLKKVANI